MFVYNINIAAQSLHVHAAKLACIKKKRSPATFATSLPRKHRAHPTAKPPYPLLRGVGKIMRFSIRVHVPVSHIKFSPRHSCMRDFASDCLTRVTGPSTGTVIRGPARSL